MNYIKGNKQAWEHAFTHRSGEYAKDLAERLKNEENPFFHDNFHNVLKPYDFNGKSIAQFCSNNGRELLQLALRGVSKAVGFELAENMVDYGNRMAQALNVNATFVGTDILAIDEAYDAQFDYGLITVGAMCWFEDLNHFFKKVSQTLKKGATLFIHEAHPFELMLATKYEPAFDADDPKRLAYDYFGKTVWKEHGMGYMSETSSDENVFTSFSHTLSDIFNAMKQNGLSVERFEEYDYCVGNILDHLDHEGLPLSMIIVAKKEF